MAYVEKLSNGAVVAQPELPLFPWSEESNKDIFKAQESLQELENKLRSTNSTK